MYPWLVYLHLVGVFGLLLAHGASANAAFALRRERRLERVQMLLELSNTSHGVMYASLGLLLLSGIIAGFVGNWWGRGWIWISLVLLLAIVAAMFVTGTIYYAKIRKGVGLPFMEGGKPHPPVDPLSHEEITVLLNAPALLYPVYVGAAGLVVILWFMVFKPF